MAIEDRTNPMQGVSGPGKFAKRTDLAYQSQSYGDGVAYNAAKSGAPLATAPKSPMLSQAPQVPAGAMPAPSSIGLFEPTQRPNEPITQGVDVGAGAGSNVLAMAKSSEKLSDTLVKMLPYDTDGSIAILYQDALARGN
jgi:hypothetical protein